MVYQLKKTLIILLKLYCIEIFYSNVDFHEGILKPLLNVIDLFPKCSKHSELPFPPFPLPVL